MNMKLLGGNKCKKLASNATQHNELNNVYCQPESFCCSVAIGKERESRSTSGSRRGTTIFLITLNDSGSYL